MVEPYYNYRNLTEYRELLAVQHPNDKKLNRKTKEWIYLS
jgi:hypothetical protein